MYAASRHGTPSLTSLPKDDEVSCEVRSPWSPIQSLTSPDQAQLQSPDEDCITHSATHPALGHSQQWEIKGIPSASVKSVWFAPRPASPCKLNFSLIYLTPFKTCMIFVWYGIFSGLFGCLAILPPICSIHSFSFWVLSSFSLAPSQ